MPRTESNRARIGRDGTRFPEHRQEIGWLRRGTQDRKDPAFDSRAEWREGLGFLEARIPWGLLNVTDPSQRRVVDDSVPPGRDEVGTSLTDGFRVNLVRFQGTGEALKPVSCLPVSQSGRVPAPPRFTWEPWEQPRWHSFRKQCFDIVQKALSQLPDSPRSRNPK